MFCFVLVPRGHSSPYSTIRRSLTLNSTQLITSSITVCLRLPIKICPFILKRGFQKAPTSIIDLYISHFRRCRCLLFIITPFILFGKSEPTSAPCLFHLLRCCAQEVFSLLCRESVCFDVTYLFFDILYIQGRGRSMLESCFSWRLPSTCGLNCKILKLNVIEMR